MYCRNSSRVVAPTQCKSPRAKAGFNMLPASIAPSAFPAPTMVCNSSMKRIMEPSRFDNSLRTAFKRSSNSPRNFAPAIKAPISKESIFLPFNPSGTSPLTIRWASPSTIAVFPTPGSPISTGLFLVRRCSTWMARLISTSRPITGSNSLFSARSVRSIQNLASACQESSAAGSPTFAPPLRFTIAFSRASDDTPNPFKIFPTTPLSPIAISKMVSLDINESPFCWVSLSA